MVQRTQPDPLVIYGKKVTYMPKLPSCLFCSFQKGGGCCLTKTNKCIIIGTYEGGGMGAPPEKFDCDSAVEKLGEYLREQNF
jgi:hypothetical protein